MPRTEIWLDLNGATEEDEKLIKLAHRLGHLCGVTTNPKILAKGKMETGLEPSTILERLQRIVPDNLPICVQIPKKTKPESIVQLAQFLHKTSDRFILKIHTKIAGLIAAHELKGIRILLTGVLSKNAFILALCANVEYVAPYLDRMRHHTTAGDYYQNLSTMMALVKAQDSSIKVMAASIRDIEMIHKCMELGVHAMTLPAKVYKEFITDDQLGLDYENLFDTEWRKTKCHEDAWFAVVGEESEEEHSKEESIEVETLQVGSQSAQKRSRILGPSSPFSGLTSYTESPASSPSHSTITTTTTTIPSFRSPSPTPGSQE